MKKKPTPKQHLQPCVIHLVPNCAWCRFDADRYRDKDFARLNAQRRKQFESGESRIGYGK